MFEDYKYMLENYGQHELFMINYILKEARKDCFLYQFRDKFIVLIKGYADSPVATATSFFSVKT